MKLKTLYFLNYKFNIYANDLLIEKLDKFWNNYLQKQQKTTISWDIYVEYGEKTSTTIDYKNQKIIHIHNSICELTEVNNLIRETIVKITASDGIVWLHCSAFQIKNKTFLVVGNKGNGKTTILLNAILNCNAKFIGNDQLPIFIKNDNIYCFSWRPDIKIATDYAKKIRIVNRNKTYSKEAKVIYLVNNTIPYEFIDTYKMSIRIGKEIIQPEKQININKVDRKVKKIDYILLLSKQQEICKITDKDILKYIKDDAETILQYKLLDIKKYMPYWNKRIKFVKVNPKAKENNNQIIQKINDKCEIFSIGNRLDFTQIKQFINLL